MPQSRHESRAGKAIAANPAGAHFLTAKTVVNDLIQTCRIHDGDLVIDFGAGLGAITGPLANAGANVLAVERNPAFLRQLRARFADRSNVRVVSADIRTFRLPHQPFSVVANIPFATSTLLLRRLLNGPQVSLSHAALVVEWGFAKKLTNAVPKNKELAWWAARFDIRLHKSIPATSFSPPPRAQPVHLTISRQPTGKRVDQVLWTLLDQAYRWPNTPVRRLCGPNAHRALRAHGVNPSSPAGSIRPHQWLLIARVLTERS